MCDSAAMLHFLVKLVMLFASENITDMCKLVKFYGKLWN